MSDLVCLMKILLSIVTLSVCAATAYGEILATGSELEVSDQVTISNLSDAEDHGVKIYVQSSESSSFSSVYVCIERNNLPQEVSATLLVTLWDSHEQQLQQPTFSVAQGMMPGARDSRYDFGGFKIDKDLIPHLSLFFSYSDRGSGAYWEFDGKYIEIQLRDVALEIFSEDRAFYLNDREFYADGQNPSCEMRSGHYVLTW